MEREAEGKIAFLNVQLERSGTSALTSVFCKKTHTNNYLNVSAHHPAKVFRGVVQCLRVRAEKVCGGRKRWQEIQHLRQVFMANGYPGAVVKNNLRGRTTPTITTVETDSPPKLLHIPYVKGVSERIERMCKPLGVKTVMPFRSTLRSLLVKVKQPSPDRKNRVVYEVLCKDCLSAYIGSVSTRLQ